MVNYYNFKCYNYIMYNTSWFNLLNKPFLNPPSYIFTPIWIILYGLLLVALILYSIKPTHKNKFRGYIYFVFQMLLNLAWSPTFFGMQNITLALIIIVLMDIFALMVIINFYKISKLSGAILIPYFLWLMFATYLNTGYLFLN